MTAAEALPIKRYAAAGGVVVDLSGQRVLVLLRRQRAGPGGDPPCLPTAEWPEIRLPKGHIEANETSKQAALREVREETGLPTLRIMADLGHQVVEFTWQGSHYVRDEHYYLMSNHPGAQPEPPESQFERLWLTWEGALERLTFEAEREWVRRARTAWQESCLQHITQQDT